MRLLLLALAAALPAQQAPAPAAPAPLAPAEQRAAFGRMGYEIGTQSPLPGMRLDYDMTVEEVDAFLAGLRLAMLGE
jgi:hypothetical protein